MTFEESEFFGLQIRFIFCDNKRPPADTFLCVRKVDNFRLFSFLSSFLLSVCPSFLLSVYSCSSKSPRKITKKPYKQEFMGSNKCAKCSAEVVRCWRKLPKHVLMKWRWKVWKRENKHQIRLGEVGWSVLFFRFPPTRLELYFGKVGPRHFWRKWLAFRPSDFLHRRSHYKPVQRQQAMLRSSPLISANVGLT